MHSQHLLERIGDLVVFGGAGTLAWLGVFEEEIPRFHGSHPCEFMCQVVLYHTEPVS